MSLYNGNVNIIALILFYNNFDYLLKLKQNLKNPRGETRKYSNNIYMVYMVYIVPILAKLTKHEIVLFAENTSFTLLDGMIIQQRQKADKNRFNDVVSFAS